MYKRQDLDWSWKNYITYRKSKRRLIVIDEALDVVRSSQVKLEDLNYVLGVIPQDVKDKHPYAILAFEKKLRNKHLRKSMKYPRKVRVLIVTKFCQEALIKNYFLN